LKRLQVIAAFCFSQGNIFTKNTLSQKNETAPMTFSLNRLFVIFLLDAYEKAFFVIFNEFGKD